MSILRKTKEEKAKATAQLKAKQLRGQVKELGEHARALSQETGAGLTQGITGLAERSTDLAGRVRDSDAYGQALERSNEWAGLARERGNEWAEVARERGVEAADVARAKLAEAGLDEKTAAVLEVLRDSESLGEARERARELGEGAIAGLGAWLGSGTVGERLGVQRRRRRWPAIVLALFGVAAGYAIGVLTAPKRGEELRDDWSAASESATDTAMKAASRVSQDTADVSAPAAEKPLADKVRTRLGEDPRTADLPKLNINVVEGTVFVRGAVPADADTEQIRGVVAEVEGVTDVDLQVTST